MARRRTIRRLAQASVQLSESRRGECGCLRPWGVARVESVGGDVKLFHVHILGLRASRQDAGASPSASLSGRRAHVFFPESPACPITRALVTLFGRRGGVQQQWKHVSKMFHLFFILHTPVSEVNDP